MLQERWQRARLIPISGIGGQQEQERRATSALLAVLTAVKEFSRAVLRPLGAPAGAVEAFCEVPFTHSDGRSLRVDGLIQVTRGDRQWTMLVEVKTGHNEADRDQVEAYLDIVRENDFDGLLTISNQISPIIGEHFLKFDKRKWKRFDRVPLHHLSWTRVLTMAVTVKEHSGVTDPDQAWILGELIRYLQYPESGALAFDDMGPHWVEVRRALRDGTLRVRDPQPADVVARWEQLLQYTCLTLGAKLGSEVRPRVSRKELEDPVARSAALVKQLVEHGKLTGGIHIPNAVGPVDLEVNLHSMTCTASVTLAAPELKRPITRVNWLLRQLSGAPNDLRIDTSFVRTRSSSTSELLGTLRDSPERALLEDKRLPRSFSLALTGRVGNKRRAGDGGFITDVSDLVEHFYGEIVQNVRAWSAPAPRLPRDNESDADVDLKENSHVADAELSDSAPSAAFATEP